MSAVWTYTDQQLIFLAPAKLNHVQETNTYSKTTVETIEKCMKYVQS